MRKFGLCWSALLVGLLFLVSPALGPGQAGASDEPPSLASTEDSDSSGALRLEALEVVKTRLTAGRSRLLVQDKRLDNVAAWMTATALRAGADRSAVRKRLWQEDIRDFEFVPLVVTGAPGGLASALETLLSDSAVDWTRYNTLGLAVRSQEDLTAVAVVLTRRSVTFAGAQEPRDQVFLSSGFSKLELFATDPGGTVHRRRVQQNEGLWTMDVAAGSPGSWLFELVAEGQRGPEVLALWPRQGKTSGKKRSPLRKKGMETPVPEETPDDAAAWVRGGARGPERAPGVEDVVAAEEHLWHLIQEVRTSRGLKALERLPGVTEAARIQASDIGRGEPFGHHTSSGTALDRLAVQGVLASRVIENVGLASDVASVHAALLASPAHRANILDPDVTGGGIGVVLRRDSRGRWSAVVSELFVELLPDLRAREGLIFEEINRARLAGGLLPLKSSRVIGQEALEAAEWVANSGGLSLTKELRERLAQKVRFHYVGIGRVGVDLLVTNDLAAGAELAHIRTRTYDEVGVGATVLRQRIGAHPPGTLVAVIVFIER